MALSSMTGFSRAHGAAGAYAWAWELKSVNAKGLDVRLRLPPGWDAVDAPVRSRAGETLSRGTVYATLTVERKSGAPTVKVNQAVLDAVVATVKKLGGQIDAAKPSVEGILALKGVIDVSEEDESEQERATAQAAVIEGFAKALADLVTARNEEGAALGKILEGRLVEIQALTKRADAAPGRQSDAVKAKLAQQIAALMESGGRFDPDRLHQEALLLAAKADIREELDRLSAHIAAARALIAEGGPAGRKLDFLSQEFNREANTLCSKSNDVALTAIGLDLKAVIDQLREQVQNIE